MGGGFFSDSDTEPKSSASIRHLSYLIDEIVWHKSFLSDFHSPWMCNDDKRNVRQTESEREKRMRPKQKDKRTRFSLSVSTSSVVLWTDLSAGEGRNFKSSVLIEVCCEHPVCLLTYPTASTGCAVTWGRSTVESRQDGSQRTRRYSMNKIQIDFCRRWWIG